MNPDDIENALGNLWASFVENIAIDVCRSRITIDLAFYYTGKQPEKHQIVFEEVSAFFFVDEVTRRRSNVVPWENAELSEAHFFYPARDHIVHRNDKKGTHNYSSEPNFYLELWSAPFLIEAKCVNIDGTEYTAMDK